MRKTLKAQTDVQKKAEVNFRKDLYRKHVLEENILETEYKLDELLSILKTRIQTTEKKFKEIKSVYSIKPGVKVLEVGSERCQRLAVAGKIFKAKPLGVDISYESLKSSDFFMEKLNYPTDFFRVCTDVYKLPFADGVFDIIYCFETLHHFPDPINVVNEVRRVLKKGGLLVVSEEPVKRFLNLGLRLTPKKNILVKFLKKTKLAALLFKEGKNEMTYGIYEGVLSLSFIKEFLNLFKTEKADVRILNKRFNLTRNTLVNKVIIFLLGGEFEGVFKK